MTRFLAAGLVLALLAASPAGAAGSGGRVPGRVPGPGVGPGLGSSVGPGVGPWVGPAPAAPLPAPPGRTTLLSRARDRGFANAGSLEPSMSTSGRWVAFTSAASDLVPGDEQGTVDVFVLDRRSGRITRAPLPAGFARSTDGRATEPAISGDGRIVAYTYQPPQPVGTESFLGSYVVAWTRATGRVTIVSRDIDGRAQDGARQPSISRDGTYIAYTSSADWEGDKDGGQDDVLRFDRGSKTTELVSWGPERRPISGTATSPSISGDGNLVAFVSDGGDTLVHENTGSGAQVFVRDMRAGRTERVSMPDDGGPARDRSYDPAISADGRYVAFGSLATNLTPEGAGGLFRRDLQAGRTIMVSVTPDGTAGKGSSAQPSITAEGRYVAWTSTAPNLVPETAGRVAPAATSSRFRSEVFIRDIDAGETVLVSVSKANTGSGGQSFGPSVGGDGRFVAFASDADTLVAGDNNEAFDVFLRDLPPVPVIGPSSLDLGARAVGTVSLPLAATLRNRGWSPLAVGAASTTGKDRLDFRVVSDGCKGRVLRRDETCTVSVIFAPKAQGARAATLAVPDAFEGSPRTVRLRGRASEGKLVLDPPIGQPGIVTIAEGSGFPHKTKIRLRWSVGITPTMGSIRTGDDGTFRVPVLVFHNDLTGPRELIVEPLDGTAFPAVASSMLVTKPSVVPPRFDIIRFIDLPLVLVIRG